MATILPIHNPSCENSVCENYLHTSTTAIVVINLASLQSPYVDPQGAMKAFHHISQRAMFSLTAGAEPIGQAIFLFLDHNKRMKKNVRKVLDDMHNVWVSRKVVDTLAFLNVTMNSTVPKHTVAVIATDQIDHTDGSMIKDPIYACIRITDTIKAFHSLLYDPICEHLRPATMAERERVFTSCPRVGSIEQHDHGPIPEDDDSAKSGVQAYTWFSTKY
ncbi:hypothetical protein HD553DRAFT_321465 [Filobasidium floriforme]|uniref:uncharacterized protein n=1 Tax=Filobasidium floriforme TaxID=5210 RepID=UPI001E8D94D6|nr:uncharacterized protein HD553DRAFT_321465 [Filobasidium floriforme]KAH8090903.1 hypothetical protein HD553DRAFT_321465 [Filobasidium floriforme]